HTRWPRDWSSDVSSSDLVLLERFEELARGGEAVVGARHHRLEHDRLELLVDLGPQRARRRLLAAVDRVDQLRQRAAVERELARRSEERRVGKGGRWGGGE